MNKTWLLFSLFALLLAACAPGTYQGLPDLPQKDWLNPAAGDGKGSKGVRSPKDAPEFYAPEKVHTFQDLVYLAIQQSPVISRGAINLEIQQIATSDAKWRYLPEMHLLYTISNNVTQYNKSKSRIYGNDYGKTEYQTAFSGIFNNPVVTYFSVQAQDELMQVAIVTQRKAIAEYINNIAGTLLLINLRERTITTLKEMLELAEKKRDFSVLRDRLRPDIFNPASYSEDYVADLELRLRETQMALTVDRTRLKQMVGVNVEQALIVDSNSVYEILSSFHPQETPWQDCWEQTEDRYLLRQQVRLEEANIMLAWAQYTPNISIVFNESPPNGQAQAAGARTDTFMHLTFDFPLLDWGHRYRLAKMSNAKKRQSQLDEVQRRREYGERWLQFEQELLLAKARAERRQHAVESANRRSEALAVAYKNGTADLEALSNFRQTELDRRLAALDAEYALATTRLAWMHHSAALSRYFLGSAGYDGKKK